MYRFRMYIPFGRDTDLLNKCVNSIYPQMQEHSAYEGKKIVVMNNSGSPIECKTKEAYIVHEADMISSRLGYIDNLEVKDGWTEKHDWYVG